MNTYININKLLKELNNEYKFTLSKLNNKHFGYVQKKNVILVKATERNSKKEFIMSLYKKKYYSNNKDYNDINISPFININDIYYIDNDMYIKFNLLKDWCILKNINIENCLKSINNINQSPRFTIDEIDFLLDKANYCGKTKMVLKLEQMKKNILNKGIEVPEIEEQKIIKNNSTIDVNEIFEL
jgi:hypothetical protein